MTIMNILLLLCLIDHTITKSHSDMMYIIGDKNKKINNNYITITKKHLKLL